MSKFYEVKKRDGAARIGRLSLNEGQIQTPLLLRVESLGSNFSSEEKTKTLTKRERDKEKFLVELFLKQKSSKEFVIFHPEDTNFKDLSSEETWNAPRGTVLLPEIHPLFQKVKEAIPSLFVDFFILPFASGMFNSPRDFVRRIIDARNSIPPDVALWVPSIAMPENVALLIYMGVDIMDDAASVIKGYQDVYQDENGEVKISELEDLPCNCSVCSSLDIEDLRRRKDKKRFSLIAQHNKLVLEKEVKKATECIRAGNLREYIEMRVRASTFLTAVLRILDTEEEYFELRTPIARRGYMKVNTMESLKRMEVKRFAKRVLERYTPSERKILLILPCSARKPYSISPSHVKFIDAIEDYRGYIHEIILTSPLGVVPRELEGTYPAFSYDIPVTGYWDEEEKKWVRACLYAYLDKNFLEKASYETIVAHVNGNGGYKEICSSVAEELGIEIVYSCKDKERTTSKEALKRLRTCVSELCGERKRLSGFERKISVIKAMAEYQFGVDAGSKLMERKEALKIKGKFPFYKLISNKEVLARIVPEYGLLALSVKGARRFKDPSYNVKIDDFVPKGSILAPGVMEADPRIRVNDEVIFSGKRAFGVGRAKMSGWEMIGSRKGVAVDVREVEEI